MLIIANGESQTEPTGRIYSVNREAVFRFLNELRESGQVNMLGALPLITETFGCSLSESRRLFRDWAESFKVS